MNLPFTPQARDSSRRSVQKWAIVLGRFGLATRGLVYVALGVLATRAAIGIGGKMTDKEGAVREIGRLPLGDVALWVVALGLWGYVAWRLAQAILDIENHGTSVKAVGKRAAALFSGLAYAGSSAAAWSLASGRSGRWAGGTATNQDHTAWLMSQPFGRWLVGAVGLTVIGIAIFQFYRGFSCSFRRHLRGLPPNTEQWVRHVGRLGYIARGIAFALIGWFLIDAARESDPGNAGGIAQALQALARQDHGSWLLGAVGIGLAMFGFYSIIEARFRRFEH